VWSEMFLSQGKRRVARKLLAAILPVAARLVELPNYSPFCRGEKNRPPKFYISYFSNSWQPNFSKVFVRVLSKDYIL
jgi:hypothetical protein